MELIPPFFQQSKKNIRVFVANFEKDFLITKFNNKKIPPYNGRDLIIVYTRLLNLYDHFPFVLSFKKIQKSLGNIIKTFHNSFRVLKFTIF